ncbi:MAG: GumC family protein, partial [Hyphomicrobiaceae bacterium]
VKYTDTSPRRAAIVANILVDEYLESQRQSKQEAANMANMRLQERVAELRNEVRLGQQQIRDYIETNNLVEIEGQTISEREIGAMLADLATARGLSAGKLAELQRVEDLAKDADKAHSIDRVLQSQVIRGFRGQEAEVRRQLAILVSQYGKNHYEVDQKRAELADIQKEIRSEIQRIVEGTRHGYEISVERVKLIEANLEKLTGEYASRQRLSIGLSELRQEVQATNEHYKNLLARQKETQAQSSMLFPDARVMSKAAPPRAPSAPRKSILLVLALVGGLGVGITLSLLREHVLDIVRGPEDVEAVTGLGHITAVPLFARTTNVPRAVTADSTSELSQSIFRIKHAVMQTLSHRTGRVVAVTSANKGEGKTSIAANLAQYLALVGHKTLLVDCDLRSANLTNLMMSEPESTLVDILEDHVAPNDVIVELEECGLHFCPAPASGMVEYSMELLASAEMSEFLDAAAHDYEYTILDTSALLPYVDARALIDAVGATVLVVEDRKTSHADLERLMRMVPAFFAKAAGVVTNKSEAMA